MERKLQKATKRSLPSRRVGHAIEFKNLFLIPVMDIGVRKTMDARECEKKKKKKKKK